MGLFDSLSTMLEFGKSISEQRKRERQYLTMTSDELSALSDDELYRAVLCRLEKRVSGYSDLSDGLAALDEKQRLLYALDMYNSEIQNGGLCQFFANSSRSAAPYISGYLSSINAEVHRRLYDDFVKKFGLDTGDGLSAFDVNDSAQYEMLYERYPFDEFDEAFGRLAPLDDILKKYIRSDLNSLI